VVQPNEFQPVENLRDTILRRKVDRFVVAKDGFGSGR